MLVVAPGGIGTMLFLVRLCLCIALFGASVTAQVPSFPIISLGDSLGEGVQSGDANDTTQYYSYASIVNLVLGTHFPLPLIDSHSLGIGTSHTLEHFVQQNLLAPLSQESNRWESSHCTCSE